MHASNRSAGRTIISNMTGLKMTIVDDHIKRLKDDGRIRLVVNGVFEPVEITQDRAISSTVVPGGGVKLEIGDVCIDLTPRECRNLVAVVGGHVLLFGR